MNYNMYIFTSLFQSNQFILIVPEYKIIIYYKKVKSNDTVCIFANVGVPTTYCRMPSGIYSIKKRQQPDSGSSFLRVYRADQLPRCTSAGETLSATHIGPLSKTCRADDCPLLGC